LVCVYGFWVPNQRAPKATHPPSRTAHTHQIMAERMRRYITFGFVLKFLFLIASAFSSSLRDFHRNHVWIGPTCKCWLKIRQNKKRTRHPYSLRYIRSCRQRYRYTFEWRANTTPTIGMLRSGGSSRVCVMLFTKALSTVCFSVSQSIHWEKHC